MMKQWGSHRDQTGPGVFPMSNVYFRKLQKNSSSTDVNRTTKDLLDVIVEKENMKLQDDIPLKVHFGEEGNETYIQPENFDGIIDYLDEKGIKTSFIETNVLYGGQRFKKEVHLETAKRHGFTRIPVIIADGEHGENYMEVEVDGNHFKSCKLGKEFGKYDQLIILSHFKGHGLAGFGGAIKQLSMGHASKGGKLAMHMGIKPKISNRKCNKCHLCEKSCAENAITIGKKSFIDHEKCVGCGVCVPICPENAIKIFQLAGITNALNFGKFREKVVEYAYAAQQGKDNIYINFIMNVTAGCDCEGKKMKVLMDDIGICVSTDPVAIDKACFDMVKKAGKKFRGEKTFDYSEKIGLGSTDYTMVEI